MSIEEIMERLAAMESHEKFVSKLFESTSRKKDAEKNITAIRAAVALLKTHPEAQPNELLTQEQLQFGSGDPVWIVREDGADRWALIRYANFGGINTYGCGFLAWEDLGEIWFPYRRPPKEETI